MKILSLPTDLSSVNRQYLRIQHVLYSLNHNLPQIKRLAVTTSSFLWQSIHPMMYLWRSLAGEEPANTFEVPTLLETQ